VSFANTARISPILLATSPLAAMRSAHYNRSNFALLHHGPAMLSEMTVVGIPSFISSHAVSREP